MMNILITFLKALLGIEPPSGNVPKATETFSTAEIPRNSIPPAATSSRFQACLAEVLKHEGGYVNHPADPGGETNFGVSDRADGKIDGMADLDRNGTGDVAIRDLTPALAAPIYHANYWLPIKGDALPPGVDLATFDFAVNSGPAKAAMTLQKVVGVAQDGAIGPITLAAVARAPGPATVVIGLCDARLAFLRSLSTWPTFGKGWTRRVSEVQAAALEAV